MFHILVSLEWEKSNLCIPIKIHIFGKTHYLIMEDPFTQWKPLVEQELLVFTEHLSSPQFFLVRVALSLLFCVPHVDKSDSVSAIFSIYFI